MQKHEMGAPKDRLYLKLLKENSVSGIYKSEIAGVLIDYYYNEFETDESFNVLVSSIPDIKLRKTYLSKLIELFITRGEYERAYDYIKTNNVYPDNIKRIYRMASKLISKYDRQDSIIDNLVEQCLTNRKYDDNIMGYLMVNYNSSTKKMMSLWEKAEGFTVLNHGQYYEGRGYELMVGACKYLQGYPEIKLALRGFGKLEQMLRDMKAAEDTEDRVVFYPPVRVEELIPMAASAHVGVEVTLPICLNFKLSVSNKLFEYAAAGLPVIMSDIPEHRYLNEKYNFGILMEENTSQCFAEAAIKLYTDKELYARLAANAARMVQEVNWDAQFEQLIADEKTIIGDRQLR